MCGTTRWKAAKATSNTLRNLDETSLVVAGCRHALALRQSTCFVVNCKLYAIHIYASLYNWKC